MTQLRGPSLFVRGARGAMACAITVFALLYAGLASGDETAPRGEYAPAPSRGWIGLQERNAWGLTAARPTDDYGVDVLGGFWAFDERVQPIFDVGWSRIANLPDGRTVDTFWAGAKVGVGEALARERLWVGATFGLALQAGLLQNATSTSTPILTQGVVTSDAVATQSSLAWAIAPSAAGLVQGRISRRLLLGAELGIEHSIPDLKWADYSVFNSFRLQLGLELGVILGTPVTGP